MLPTFSKVVRWPWEGIAEGVLLLGISALILWRGGKSIDATWFFLFLAWFVGFVDALTAIKERRFSRMIDPKVYLLTALFLAATVLSFFTSKTANYGLDEVFQTLSAVTLFLWMARGRSEKTVRRIISAIVWTAILASIIGVAVYIAAPVNRFVGTFFDARFHTDFWPNAWGEFLLLVWPLTLWTFQDTRGRGGRVFRVLLNISVSGFVLGSLLLSYSRASLIALFGQLVVGFVLLFFLRRPNVVLRRLFSHAVVIGLVALLTYSVVNGIRSERYPVTSLSEKAAFATEEGTSSITERRSFWMQTLALSREHPYIGWGPYSFRFIQPSLQNEVLATSDHPHNVFLKFALERGWPAAAVFALLLATVFIPYLRMIGKRNIANGKPHALFTGAQASTAQVTGEEIVAIVATLGVLMHNLVDYNLQFIGIALPFWLLLGFLASQRSMGRELRSRYPRVLESVLLSFALIFALREGVLLVTSSLGRHAETRGEVSSALAWYERSAKELFSRDLFLSRGKLLLEQKRKGEAAAVLRTYLSSNAEDARAYRLLGRAEEGTGALLAFAEAYRRGKWNDIGTAREYYEALRAVQGGEALRAQKSEADMLVAAYAAAISRNAHFIALSQNVEEFIALSDLLSEVFPDDAPRYQVLAAQADFKAKEERGRLSSRKPGILW